MLKRLLLATAIGAAVASPAAATEWFYCADAENVAQAGLLLGTVDGFSPVAATLRAGEKSWVSDPAYNEGEALTVGQGYQDEHQVLVSFLDGNSDKRIGDLRVVRGEEGDTLVFAGVLHIPGQGVWPVSCDGWW